MKLFIDLSMMYSYVTYNKNFNIYVMTYREEMFLLVNYYLINDYNTQLRLWT